MTTDPEEVPGTPQELNATSPPARIPRPNKRPEKALWRGNRLSAKKSEEAHVHPQPEKKSHSTFDTSESSQLDTSFPSHQDHPSSGGSEPQTQEAGLSSKTGPYKISFWWAPPPPSPSTKKPTRTSDREMSNRDNNVPKQEPLDSSVEESPIPPADDATCASSNEEPASSKKVENASTLEDAKPVQELETGWSASKDTSLLPSPVPQAETVVAAMKGMTLLETESGSQIPVKVPAITSPGSEGNRPSSPQFQPISVSKDLPTSTSSVEQIPTHLGKD